GRPLPANPHERYPLVYAKVALVDAAALRILRHRRIRRLVSVPEVDRLGLRLPLRVHSRRFGPATMTSGPLGERTSSASVGRFQTGQTEKNSVRAYIFRFALERGHSPWRSASL